MKASYLTYDYKLPSVCADCGRVVEVGVAYGVIGDLRLCLDCSVKDVQQKGMINES